MIKSHLLLLSTLVSFSANADWVTNDKADLVLESSTTAVDVEENGTFVMHETREFSIKNDSGRSQMALEKIPYNPEFAEVTVLEGAVTTAGMVAALDLKNVRSQPMSGGREGLQDLRELVLPFTNLQVGSRVRYRYQTKTKKAAVPGLFTMSLSYGVHYPEVSGEVTVRSVRKIFHAMNDPRKNLLVSESNENGKHVLKVRLISPALRSVRDEVVPVFNKDMYIFGQITTGAQWSELAQHYTAKYEAVLNQPLPKNYAEILKKASAEKDLYRKIDLITSELAGSMTYQGDWVTLDKMMYPRSLQEVASLKVGDCKDFASATTAILRAMGVKASIALVNRRSPYSPFSRMHSRPLRMDLVTMDPFNHAVVRVEHNGAVFWVDPTNAVSNSQYTFDDIVGSCSLQLAAGVNALEVVKQNAEGSTLKVTKKIKIMPSGMLDTSGQVFATGAFSQGVLELANRHGQEKAEEALLSMYGTSKNQASPKIEANFKTRFSDVFVAEVRTHSEKAYAEKDGKQVLAIPLPTQLQGYFLLQKGRSTDLYVFPKSEIINRFVVEGHDFDSEKTQGCVALSPWFDLDRSLYKTEKGFEVEDRISLKRELIESIEGRMEEFDFSMGDLGSCVQSQALYVKKLEGSLKDRLKSYSYDEVKRLSDENGPNRKTQWRKMVVQQLLRAEPENQEFALKLAAITTDLGYRHDFVYGFGYIDSALKMVDRLLAKNPKSDAIYLQKATILMQGMRLPEAIGYFASLWADASKRNYELYSLGAQIAERKKQNDFALGYREKALAAADTPLRRAKSHMSLGRIYRDQANHLKAEEYFQKALQDDPKNAWFMNDLVLLYTRQQKHDKAIEVGERMLKVTDFGVGRINLASAYCSKANSLVNSRHLSDLEKSAELAMTGIKYSGQSEYCIAVLASSYRSMAVLRKDASSLERALAILEEGEKIRREGAAEIRQEKARVQALLETAAPIWKANQRAPSGAPQVHGRGP